MQSKTISLVITLMAFISQSWCAVPLYPLGPKKEVRALRKSANPAATLQLNQRYTIFGEEHARIFISDNGYVTFDAPLLSTLPKPFPIKSGSYVSQRSVMVAPYWSDIDTRCGGKVYYWQVDVTQGSGLFKKIQDDVALARLGALFNPTSAVIVTWKAVTPENTFPCRDKRRNTFQLVLTSDGSRLFAMFRYESLEWHTSNIGAAVNRRRGPATAGVNAGDRINGFNVSNDPNSASIISLGLPSISNVGVPGLFVYRLN